MRKIALLSLSILLFSCSERKTQNASDVAEKQEMPPKKEEVTEEGLSESDEKFRKEEEEGYNCKPVEKPDLQIKSSFFGADTKITVGVYTKNYISERIHNKDEELKEVKLAHQISLNQAQKDTLFQLLCGRQGGYGMGAKCYSPRHLITFHKADKQIGCIEICFECSRSVVKDLPFGISCATHHEDVKAFFDSIGLEKPKG